MSCAFESLVFVIYIVIFHIRNSVRVVLLKAPRWQTKRANVGIKQTHEINPVRVQPFLIRHVIGKNKTRTWFENPTLSLTRGRLVPRQPRAFKSITATQLLHEKYLIAQHYLYCHLQARKPGQPSMALITQHNLNRHRIMIGNLQNNIYPII